MPADQEFSLTIGQDGLNLRDQAAEVPPSQLVDSVNWRIDENGALVKRNGYVTYTTLPALPLAQTTYAPVAGTTELIFQCSDGFVYSSPGDGSLTAIAGGLSTVAMARFASINDKLYWTNGTDPVQQWDGSTLVAITGIDDVQTISITGTPTGGTVTLTFEEAATTALAYNATATNVHDALVLLPSIGTGNVNVTGGPWPGTPIVVTFVNTLADTALPLIVTTDLLTGGSAPASHVAHTTTGRGNAPLGHYLAVWRNRLWVLGSDAFPNRIWWSGAGDATIWPQLNFVDILGPTADQITGATAAPNIATSFDGADGVLVYKKHSLHRIVDDSDNDPTNDVISGGANVLVDSATGTLSAESIVHQNARVYCLAQNGIYSTDGHTSQVLESGRLGRFFATSISPSQVSQGVGIDFRGTIMFAIPDVTTGGSGTLTLELMTGLVSADHTHPIMAHSLPIALGSVLPQTTASDLLIFCDASLIPTDDRLQVRTYPSGGSDAKQSASSQVITAYARSGATIFSTPKPKRFRRLQVTGRGSLIVGVETDLESGPGEAQSINLGTTITGAGGSGGSWDDGGKWDDGRVWDSGGGGGGTLLSPIQTGSAWYTSRGRRFGFYISHTGSDAGATTGSLGAASVPTGGAAVYDLTARITPLEGEV